MCACFVWDPPKNVWAEHTFKCGVKFNSEWCKKNRSLQTHFQSLLHSINGCLVCFWSDGTKEIKVNVKWVFFSGYIPTNLAHTIESKNLVHNQLAFAWFPSWISSCLHWFKAFANMQTYQMVAIAELLNRKHIRWFSFETYIRARRYFRSQNGDCTIATHTCWHTDVLMYDRVSVQYPPEDRNTLSFSIFKLA